MSNQASRTIWILTIGAFFAFFVFGFSDNLKGPTIPALLEDMQFNYSIGGTILLGAYVGFMAATLSTGFIADAAGQKAVLLLAGICLGIGVWGFSSFQTPLVLTLAMIVLGFGLGSLELGCNALIVQLHSSDKGRYLNLMAVMHGMGSMIAPLYAGIMLSANISWRTIYRWDTVLICLMFIFFAVSHFPKRSSTVSEKINFSKVGRSAFSSIMLWYYATITVYVALELGIASWLVEYLQKQREYNISESTRALSIFFGLIMVGRFVGSFLVERFGYLKSTLGAALGTSICLFLALFGPTQYSILLPISGFFLSIIFPTITAAASDAHKENLNTILGLLFTFGGLGGILGPWLIGIASDIGGLNFGFRLNLWFGILTGICILILIALQKKPIKNDD